MVASRLHIEGGRELNKLLRQIGGRELQKELGQVHRRIGQMVIAHVGGAKTGVGRGAGETIRPSAAAREVLLRVGGSHRSERPEQWGREQVWPGGLPPVRPHLIEGAREIEDEISEEYLSGIDSILRRHGVAG